MKKRVFFITGTDTDTGKTIITAALLRSFREKGIPVNVLKPVQTGSVPDPETGFLEAPDVAVYRQALPGEDEKKSIKEPRYSFLSPCSPHLAAELESTQIAFEEFISYIEEELAGESLNLIEGAGGIFTPVNRQYSYLDVLKRLGLKVIVVTDNKLGMLNHTRQTIEILHMHGIETAALVINHSQKKGGSLDQKICEDNILYLKKLFSSLNLFVIPHIPEIHSTDTALQQEGWQTLCRKFDSCDSLFFEDESSEEESMYRDRNNIFHPYTSLKTPLKTYKVERAEGNYLYRKEGKLLDGMSSWWCAVHGYNNRELNRAVIKQTNRVAHVMFGGITHSPAIDLTEKLLSIVPDTLDNVFYSDSGSVSVEVALKMAIQYWQGTGQVNKNKILAFEGAYHGDTFGAMSVCDPHNGMHHLFSGILPRQYFVPRPASPFNKPFRPESLSEIREHIEKNFKSIAAVIIEPIVQGAGGMWIYHPEYLKGLKKLCSQFDILLICDEIATGFGRTGRLFASEWAEIQPDIMCIGKALTGGYLSFAATLTTRKVSLGISARENVFMHGPTFMGNPLACSVACASIDLLQKNDWKNQVSRIETGLTMGLSRCLALPEVRDVRILGAIGVVELDRSINIEQIQEYFVRKGVWIRPYGKLLYLMPPYTCSREEILYLSDVIYKSITNKKY